MFELKSGKENIYRRPFSTLSFHFVLTINNTRLALVFRPVALTKFSGNHRFLTKHKIQFRVVASWRLDEPGYVEGVTEKHCSKPNLSYLHASSVNLSISFPNFRVYEDFNEQGFVKLRDQLLGFP